MGVIDNQEVLITQRLKPTVKLTVDEAFEKLSEASESTSSTDTLEEVTE